MIMQINVENAENKKIYQPKEIHNSPGIYQHREFPHYFIIVAQDQTAISINNKSETLNTKRYMGSDAGTWGTFIKIKSPITLTP